MWYLIGLLTLQMVAMLAICRKDSGTACRLPRWNRGLDLQKF